ncbi:hypothetical protein CMV_021095 [Castanea mollissima]|uniref:Uncharacterized protein n=1 Tax=Castanea mollissima TaxID=60419 RepID=A0A8J4QV06_9ROSI|nr:hypothetical protein CMV_021095 [Castanea mollissima]
MFFLTLPIRLLLEVYRREKSVCFVEKYLILAPWAIQGIYSFIVKEESERDLTNFLILPFLLWRMLHNQIWISLSRYRNAKGGNLLVDKSLEFEQVDREQNWDDISNITQWNRILPIQQHENFFTRYHSLSLPFSPPFLNCHRAYDFCHSSICQAHSIFYALHNTIGDYHFYRNCFFGFRFWLCYLHRLDEQHGSL